MAVVFRLRLVDYDERRTRLIYIYIYLVFFLYLFIERALSVVRREGDTQDVYFCIFASPVCFFEWHPRNVEREQHHTWLIFVIKADAQGGGHERKRKRHRHCRHLVFPSSREKLVANFPNC